MKHSKCVRTPLTSINVRDDDLGALVREEPRGLCANALTRSSDDSYLARQHTLRVVEVACDLFYTLACHLSGVLCWKMRMGKVEELWDPKYLP